MEDILNLFAKSFELFMITSCFEDLLRPTRWAMWRKESSVFLHLAARSIYPIASDARLVFLVFLVFFTVSLILISDDSKGPIT